MRDAFAAAIFRGDVHDSFHPSRGRRGADTPDTVGTVLYVSPGLTASVLPTLHVYGFAQLPVYSNLDGYQLFPRITVSVGLSYAFGGPHS